MAGMVTIRARYSVNVDEARLNLAVMNPAIDYGKRVQSMIKREAIRTAPRRSGQLATSHLNIGILRRGRWAADGAVRNVSEHAEYVHGGTDGPIFPNAPHRFLKIHGSRAGHAGAVTGYARSVRGQRANPWLRKAGETVAARMGGNVSIF